MTDRYLQGSGFLWGLYPTVFKECSFRVARLEQKMSQSKAVLLPLQSHSTITKLFFFVLACDKIHSYRLNIISAARTRVYRLTEDPSQSPVYLALHLFIRISLQMPIRGGSLKALQPFPFEEAKHSCQGEHAHKQWDGRRDSLKGQRDKEAETNWLLLYRLKPTVPRNA